MLFNSFFQYEQRPFEGEFDDCLYLEYAILLYRPATRAHKRVTGSFILGSNFLIVLEEIPSGLLKKHTKRSWRTTRGSNNTVQTTCSSC